MTRTYYLRSDDRASGVHTASYEKAIENTVGSGPNEVNRDIPIDSEELSHMWTSDSGVPGVTDWPSGTYTVSLDVATCEGDDVNYGPCTVSSANGHIAIVDSGLSSDVESKTLGSPTTGTGIKTFSDTWDPGSSSDTDRLEVLIGADNTYTHQARQLGIDCESSNSYISGPWEAEVGGLDIPLAMHHYKQMQGAS